MHVPRKCWSFLRLTAIAAVLLSIPLGLSAQKRKPVTKKPVAKPAATVTTTPLPEPSPTPEATKKNSGKANARPEQKSTVVTKGFIPVYFYTFDRPGFTYSPLHIEHDENGKGEISMKRDGYTETWTDPIQLTAVTMANLKAAFAALNFLDSTESYQYPNRDYPQMGNLTITVKTGGKERTVKFNWTENKEAKVLMDEYRRISNEYTWRLEMTVARENQPLLTPGLMETMDGYVQSKEVTDPPHLVTFLTELSLDERLPLMARNRATRIIERIQKAAKKN